MFRKFLLLFLLLCVPVSKSINSSSLSRKKYDRDKFTVTSRKGLQGQNTSVGIGLIELNEPSDTVNCKQFL